MTGRNIFVTTALRSAARISIGPGRGRWKIEAFCLQLVLNLLNGAIASGGVRVLNDDVVRAIPYASEAIEAVTARETVELQRREQIYREGRPAPELRDKIAILVDDGLATGATMRAAVKALQQRGTAKIVVAVPVGPPDTCEEIAQEADETICLSTPPFFQAVGQYYDDFSQTSDEDVRELLTKAAQERQGGAVSKPPQ